MTGLPGLRGVEHVGLTVPDLEAAEAFLCGVLGAELVFDGGEISGADAMTRILGTHAANRCRYRFYRLGTGLNLEVFEYLDVESDAHPGNAARGGHHIALYVDDISAAAAHLKAHDVELSGSPEHVDRGPAAGSDWLYFKAPWGLQMELVSFPHGKAYEMEANVKLWSPLRPAD
ncbi:VOC family protein [Palleronia sediminis]|uniref:VOC family protein n=1 Tax=Palleronia sediminis TaxID=2547833 RepID=A0A4R6AHR6_9RHOB|nr:VOC family protein [Palleronia sediminis]TDL81186.1 VOC family protein [Palleronia sediminis]